MDYYQTTELDSSKIDNSGKEIIENFHKRRQREIKDGKYTGRNLQWHPGGGHHGPDPYWKVSSPEGGVQRVGPQF